MSLDFFMEMAAGLHEGRVGRIKHSVIKPVLLLLLLLSSSPPLLPIHTPAAYLTCEILALTLSKSPTIREFTIPGSSMLQTSFSFLAHHTSSIFLLLKNEGDLTSSFRFPTILQVSNCSYSSAYFSLHRSAI